MNFVCQFSMSIYISEIRHILLNEVYFGFFQTFEDSLSLPLSLSLSVCVCVCVCVCV